VVSPIHNLWKCSTKAHHMSAKLTTEGINFLVVQDVDHLYDMLLSTLVARNWDECRSCLQCAWLPPTLEVWWCTIHGKCSTASVWSALVKARFPALGPLQLSVLANKGGGPADGPQAPKTNPYAAQEFASKTICPASARTNYMVQYCWTCKI